MCVCVLCVLPFSLEGSSTAIPKYISVFLTD